MSLLTTHLEAEEVVNSYLSVKGSSLFDTTPRIVFQQFPLLQLFACYFVRIIAVDGNFPTVQRQVAREGGGGSR
jgi:hypothetical protein